MTGHKGTVTCLKYIGSTLITGSDDGSLVLWELGAGNLQITSRRLVQQHHKNTKRFGKVASFVGHGGPVWCLDFEDDVLASGSYDNCIKLWSIKRSDVQATLRGHTNWVSGVQLSGDRLVSSSWDGPLAPHSLISLCL